MLASLAVVTTIAPGATGLAGGVSATAGADWAGAEGAGAPVGEADFSDSTCFLRLVFSSSSWAKLSSTSSTNSSTSKTS